MDTLYFLIVEAGQILAWIDVTSIGCENAHQSVTVATDQMGFCASEQTTFDLLDAQRGPLS